MTPHLPRHGQWIAAAVLAAAVLAQYVPLLLGRVLPVPDDVFVSDLVDGEFPAHGEIAALARAGEPPAWSPGIATGTPLTAHPLAMVLFTVLPRAAALGWFVGLHLLVGALGAFLLARRCGASRSGAFLSGFAFAWSGFFVCQLRHLGVVATVAFFPLALFFLEMAATGGFDDVAKARSVPLRARLAWLLAFAALFGWQLLAGFPQSAYISALVYGSLTAARIVWLLLPSERTLVARDRLRPALGLALPALAAVAVAALVGMFALLPMAELGSVSDRSGGGTFQWATSPNYWPPNVLTFFVPYANGDVSENTYEGNGVFWEDYGYVGLTTVLLAAVAIVLGRRRFAVAFWAIATLLAYGLVLGREGPFFKLAFDYVPGMSRFRFPTRFLFVVELGLALLGGLGLTYLQDAIGKVKNERLRPFLRWATIALVAVTAIDLVWVNHRQNPMADAKRWLATPRSAEMILASGEGGRVFSPAAFKRHTAVFRLSHGWSGDLSLYYEHREFLQPNSNLLHGISTLDGYAGISPRWIVDLIGDHNRQGLVRRLWTVDEKGFGFAPGFYEWLEALSVHWLILPFKTTNEHVEHYGTAGPAEVHRLPHSLPRARVATRARLVPSTEELFALTVTRRFDPRREVVFQEPEDASVVEAINAIPEGEAGAARIVVDRATEVAIEASAPRGGLLLLSDTFYPGWEATLDGAPAKILRANVAHRGVVLPPGDHKVVFTYRPRSFRLGLALSGLGVALLLLGAVIVRRMPREAPAAPER